MSRPKYIDWLLEEENVILEDEKIINCYKLDYKSDSLILDEWAKHIRTHYATDEDIEEGSIINGISIEEYLREYIIPQKTDEMGGTARANAWSEIIFSDLLQFLLGYCVPRCRLYNMSGKTVSEHGTDVIGYKFYNADKEPHINDELVSMEVKAVLSQAKIEVVSSAVAGSKKDEDRISRSLDYYRKKLKMMGKKDEAEDIKRFQLVTVREYQTKLLAAGVTSIEELDAKNVEGIEMKVLVGIRGDNLEIATGENIFFIHGKRLMDLVHEIFERCIQ